MSKRRSKYKDKKEAEGTQYRVPDIQAKTENQKLYMSFQKTKPIVIALGHAGSGKTFLATWWAAKQYVEGKIDKIIITRPYVHMGKDGGAIPGTDFEKLEPFVRPMLINLRKFLGPQYDYMVNRGLLEVATAEKIRGRSFDENCIIIGDEMQNCTAEQLEAIVTRKGQGCQMILCGDPVQHDLKGLKPGISDLADLVEEFEIEEIGIVRFTPDDCVRDALVRKLLKAYESRRNRK